jgi:flagellar motor component MotA
MNLPRIIGAGIMFVMILLGMGLSNIGAFIDIPSVQIVVILTIASMFVTSNYKYALNLPSVISGKIRLTNLQEAKPYIQILESMTRISVAAGSVGMFIGLILLLGNMSDVESIGPNMAVAMICPMYGLIFAELILQPVKRMILSRVEGEIEGDNGSVTTENLIETSSQPQSNNVLIIILFTTLVFFILLFSFSELKNGDGEPFFWKSENLKEIKFDAVSIFGISSKEFEGDWKGIGTTAFTNEKDSLVLLYNPQVRVNNDEVLINFQIIAVKENRSKDFGNFVYPISLTEDRVVSIENDSLSIQFTVSPILGEEVTK